jgi:pSer/pThr/pTyr-binding forkhead associated (FHA) protein
MIKLGTLQREHEELFRGRTMPAVGPAVLVEADRASDGEADEADAELPGGWRTEQYNVKNLKLAMQGRIERLQALVPFVSDNAAVYRLVKSERNTAPQLCIGRAKRNDVVINDKTISSMHAQLELTQKAAFLSDLGSSNGTFVNSARLADQERKVVQSGDSVQLGKRLYYFLTGDRLITLMALRIVRAS